MVESSIYIAPDYNLYEFKSDRIWRTDGIYEPFVYFIKEKSTGMSYIGSRIRKECLETDLGKKYFTSSQYVNWTSDEFEILSIRPCASNHDALILESLLIESNNAVYSCDFYNKQNNGILFNMSGIRIPDESIKRMADKLTGRKLSEGTRNKMSVSKRGVNHPFFGKTHSKDTLQKISDKLSGRSLTEETKAKIKENRFWKNKKRPRCVCPHCGKEGGGGAMKRWHFEKCNFKNQ